MSLPISDIVKVDIAVSPTLAPLAGFGEMLFLTEDVNDVAIISLAERQRSFGSLAEVETAFSSHITSEVIPAATAFFAQTPQPTTFTVGVGASGEYSAVIRGGKHQPLTMLLGITAGTIIFIEDGVEYTASNLDFSKCADLPAVATVIQAGLRAATQTPSGAKTKATKVDASAANNRSATYSGDRFVLVAGTAGTNSTLEIKYPMDTSSSSATPMALGLSPDVYTAIQGGATEDLSMALSAISNVSNTFVAVEVNRTYRDKEAYILKVADWCEANKKIFLNTTNDVNVMSMVSQENTLAKKIKDKSYMYTITTFGRIRTEYPSSSLFGRIATVNYEGTNTCITLKFKKLPTITALELTTSQKRALDNLYIGGFMSFGGNLLYAEARMANGGWIDTVHGLLWLTDRVQKGVFNLLYGSTTKIPYTDTGINMVVQKVTGALEQGVRNGLIAAGNTPEGDYLPNGYEIVALGATQVAAEDKSNRLYRGITFRCIGAGALHNVIISGSFSE